MNYFKILHTLQYGDKNSFDISVEEQKTYLKSLGDADGDIDRGFKQYLCQNYCVKGWKVWTLNIVAAIFVPFMVAYFLFKGACSKKGEKVHTIIEDKGMVEVIPQIVTDTYHPDCRYWHERASLSLLDLTFLLKMIARAPRHPYFVLKAMMNVAYYSDMIRSHCPSVIIQFGEFSFSSSVLTAYCHEKGVKHIDIMHGEKLFFIRDAFFHYDECYVWDEYYAELFRSLMAEPTQFRVALPSSLRIDADSFKNSKVFSDYKYYLAFYNEEQIASIVRSMAFAKGEGKTVKYRPHPRYSDMELLKKYVRTEEIEMPKEVGIIESISNLDYAVGSYTTVLSQAFFSGKGVVLDDVTFESVFHKLKEFKYILSSKDTVKLSELQ